jgi:hypothetical protein
MQTDKSALEGSRTSNSDYSGAASCERAEPRRADTHRHATLVSTIEGEIVPRLLMLCRSASPVRATPGHSAGALEPGDVEELARLLLAHGPGMACEYVETIRQRGTPYERICLDLLAPTARRLVDRWEQQEFSYPELTSGLDALHAVVLEVSGAARSDRPVSRGG